MTDAKLRRTVRRGVALLLLPLSVAADAVRRIATEEYFLDSLPFGWLVPSVLFYSALLYLLGSALSGLTEPPEEEPDPEESEDDPDSGGHEGSPPSESAG